MTFNDFLLSVNSQIAGGIDDEGLPSINNSNTFYTKGLLSTVAIP